MRIDTVLIDFASASRSRTGPRYSPVSKFFGRQRSNTSGASLTIEAGVPHSCFDAESFA